MGEPSAGSFEELAMPLFDSLYNFAGWLTGSREEAEDLVQETYLKALKGFSSFQQGTNFRAWIFRILRNAFLTSRTGLKATRTVPLESDDEETAVASATMDTPESILLGRAWIFRILRNAFLTSRTGLKATRTVPLESDDEETAVASATMDTPESILLGRASQEAIQAALGKLPVIFREVLLLSDVEEMSYQEISETVAIPIGTVMSRLYRARRAMREELQGASNG